MANFLEAMLTLLPSDAGGRASHISPREGSYRPYALSADGDRLRIRVIEGPPSIAPGNAGRVVVEVEPPVSHNGIAAGAEYELIEHERRVGILTVMRCCRVEPA